MTRGHGTASSQQEHPAFVCRREGHVPTIELRPNVFVVSFVCRCSRCGRDAEFLSKPPIDIRRATS